VELSFKDHDKESPEERLQDAINVMVRDPSLLTGFFDHQILPHAQANNPRIAERLLAARDIAENDREPQAFSRLLDALDMPAWASTHWVEEQRRTDALAHFEGLKTAAANFGSASAFFDHLNSVELNFEARYTSSKKTADASALWLADIPSVKGLEFEHVVIPFLTKSQFPSAQRESMDDERNLFYVAMTRAKSALTLLGSKNAPSQFLAEL
jgi:DNA helicase-2/ATP-dependent DNA helicase PcrA